MCETLGIIPQKLAAVRIELFRKQPKVISIANYPLEDLLRFIDLTGQH
jgi:hypothetical protein